MADIALKHRVFRIDSTYYFYDGSLPVKKGVITIPHGKADWAGNAYLNGYELDPETDRYLTPGEIQRRVTSKEKPLEGSDTGGQSVR